MSRDGVPGVDGAPRAGGQPGAEEVLAAASAGFAAHGGAVTPSVPGALVDGEGTARVRFTGACAGCWGRAACLEVSVRPALLGVPGVRRVEAVGVRLSRAAQERVARLAEPAG